MPPQVKGLTTCLTPMIFLVLGRNHHHKRKDEDEDEEPEAPPPVSHRALEKATLVSSETTHTTPTDQPIIAQKVSRKCPPLVPQEQEDEQDEPPPTPAKRK